MPGAVSLCPAPVHLLLVDLVRKGKKIQNRISLGSSPIYTSIKNWLYRDILICDLSSPLVRQLEDGAWHVHRLQGLQGIQDDAPLAFHVPGFPEHATPPELDPQRARRLDLRHPLGFVSHGDRAKTGFLRSALDQTDGLMALGSDRDQKEDVDRGCLQLL